LYDCTLGDHRYEDGILRLAFYEVPVERTTSKQQVEAA